MKSDSAEVLNLSSENGAVIDLYAVWADGIPVAEFAMETVAAEEGSNAAVRVYGGNADADSSVKLYLAYNTAAAADVDLAKGTVSDATERVPPEGGSPSLATAKGLKFPLALSWAKGEIGEKVVTIPTKTDKTVEDDEFFTLQLADAQGMKLGGDRLLPGAVDCVATTPSLVIDRSAKPAKNTATSTTVAGIDQDAAYYACFITSAEDKDSVELSVDGVALSGAPAETPA